MPIARVQHVEAVSNTVPFGSTPTAGNLLVALTMCSNAITAFAGTANTWQKAVGIATSGDSLQFTDIWYALNCAGSAETVTATNGFGSGFAHIAVAEYSGLAIASALDQVNAGEGTHPTFTFAPNSGNIITTQPAELLVGCIQNTFGRSITWDSGWTELYDDQSGGAGRCFSWAEQIVSSTGTFAASGVVSGVADNSGWQACVASFKAATVTAKALIPRLSRPQFYTPRRRYA